MKKIILTTLSIALILISCQKDKEEPINQLPSAPVLLEPENGAITSNTSVTFKWLPAQDPEGDGIRYTMLISTDTVNWTEFARESDFTLSSAASTDAWYYFPFKSSQKYYWKVKVENPFNTFDNSRPARVEEGESISETFYFITAPPNVSGLRDSSGHEFVNLYWEDPENIEYVEIEFSPSVSGISQPIKVNKGIEKLELQGMENGTLYSFTIKTYDANNSVSAADTIKSLPLLPIQVHDVDFNIYNTTTIGTQTWLRENLRVTKYQDGSPIPLETGYMDYIIGNDPDKYGYYYYNEIASNGREKDVNPCPCGYHVPSEDEWKVLESYLGMKGDELDTLNRDLYRGEQEGIGKALKSTSGWKNFNGNNGNGSDFYKFGLYPGGYYSDFYTPEYSEYSSGEKAYLWTSTAMGLNNVIRIFSNESDGVSATLAGGLKCPIRCIKD